MNRRISWENAPPLPQEAPSPLRRVLFCWRKRSNRATNARDHAPGFGVPAVAAVRNLQVTTTVWHAQISPQPAQHEAVRAAGCGLAGRSDAIHANDAASRLRRRGENKRHDQWHWSAYHRDTSPRSAHRNLDSLEQWQGVAWASRSG